MRNKKIIGLCTVSLTLGLVASVIFVGAKGNLGFAKTDAVDHHDLTINQPADLDANGKFYVQTANHNQVEFVTQDASEVVSGVVGLASGGTLATSGEEFNNGISGMITGMTNISVTFAGALNLEVGASQARLGNLQALESGVEVVFNTFKYNCFKLTATAATTISAIYIDYQCIEADPTVGTPTITLSKTGEVGDTYSNEPLYTPDYEAYTTDGLNISNQVTFAHKLDGIASALNGNLIPMDPGTHTIEYSVTDGAFEGTATYTNEVLPYMTQFNVASQVASGDFAAVSVLEAHVGIVDDANASNGKALKAEKSYGDSRLTGMRLDFATPINVADYLEINLYLRTESNIHTGMYLNGGNQVYNWGQYGTYTAVNIKSYCNSESISSLTSVLLADTDRTGSIYLDKIELVELIPHDYDFSSLDDNDAETISGYSVTFTGMVADAEASNGFAYKFVTPASCWDHRAALAFDSPIDPDDYDAIVLVAKVSVQNPLISGDNVYSTGTFVLMDGVGVYKEYNLLENAYISALDSISNLYFVNGCSNTQTEVWIDKVVFYPKEAKNYDFSSPYDSDRFAVATSSGEFTAHGIEAVSGATDGYAYRLSVTTTAWNHYAYVNFDETITISEYSSIKVRIKFDNADNWVAMLLDGRIENDPTYGNTFMPMTGSADWVEYDLLSNPYFANGVSSFAQIAFVHGNGISGNFWIDSITFVAK